MQIRWYVRYVPISGRGAPVSVSGAQLAARLSEFADDVQFDDDGGVRVGFTDQQVVAEGIQAASAAVMAEQGFVRQGRPQMVPVYSAGELARARTRRAALVAEPTGEESAAIVASGDLGSGKSWLVRELPERLDGGEQ